MAAVNTWHAVNALACKLAAQGQLVTQLHCTGTDVPPSWVTEGSVEAAIHGGSFGDLVITSDGRHHPIEGAQA